MTEIILIIAILLQIADGITTYLILQIPGGYESNGIMASIFQKIGVLQGLVIFKLAWIALCWLAYLYGGIFTDVALALIVGFYVKLLMQNLRAFRVRGMF